MYVRVCVYVCVCVCTWRVCCNMLQCCEVCCGAVPSRCSRGARIVSVLQLCCSVLRCVARTMQQEVPELYVCCSCVAARCICVAVCCSVLQCFAMCCSMFQRVCRSCVAVCCTHEAAEGAINAAPAEAICENSQKSVTATHCNTTQHTATYYNILQRTALVN